MPVDLPRVRADTPGVDHVAHLNNAGAALPPRVVTDTVVEHLRREATIGGYEAAAEAAERTAAVYASIARLLGASPPEIAVVDNATRAWDMVVYGFPFRRGDRVLTARAEYASNAIALLQLARRHELEIVLVDDDEHGQIDLDHLDAELARGAALVSLTHVPTSGGLVNPAAEVGARCREHGAFFMLDACQSAGQLPLDVTELGCDALSATGRKYLRGPRGTGLLYVRDEWIERIEPPLLDLHSAEWTGPDRYEIRGDARRFETWECSHAARLGLGAAVDHALEVGVAAGWERLRDLGEQLRRRLGELDRVSVHDKGRVRGGIVTFTVDGVPSADVQAALSRAAVNTSTTTPSHSVQDGRALPAMVRASAHYYNTEDELDRLLDVVAAL
ncbi:MAG TPA: aminotransferase class V-fold PLP-dependent enzyme [Acidimicrobiales bacterium]|nr:aminotransferase class V-fold PLP-dependent enzyme [Acidimicrobiales bacterium]